MKKLIIALSAVALTCCALAGLTACDEKQCTHNYEEDIQRTVEATCHSDGIRYLVCTECDDEKTEQITERPAHAYGEGEAIVWVKVDETHHAKQCIVEGCGYVDEESTAEHNFVTDLTKLHIPATCHSDGINYLVCSECGEEKTEQITERPAHGYGEGEAIVWVKVDETLHAQQCIVGGCGHIDEENAVEHNFVADLTKTDVPATCISDGINYLVCLECGEEKTEQITERPAHAYGKGEAIVWVKVDETLHAKQCIVQGCGHIDVETAVKHNFVADLTKTDVPATCHSDGIKYLVCSDCGEEKTEADVNRPEHNFGGEWIGEADGHHRICLNDGCTQANANVEHNWKDIEEISPPTQTDDGEMKIACEDCGYESTRAIPALNHIEGDKLIYSADGTTHWYPCVNPEHIDCDVKFDEKTHEYITELTEQGKQATCKEDGIKVLACECGATVEEIISKTTVEHTWDNGEQTKDATCQEKGEITYSCTVCGETKTEETDKLDHNFGDWICEADGHYKQCQNEGCGETSEKEAHTWEEEVIQSTFWADGKKTATCSVCGKVIEETIPAKISTSYKEGFGLTIVDEKPAGDWCYGSVEYQWGDNEDFVFEQFTAVSDDAWKYDNDDPEQHVEIKDEFINASGKWAAVGFTFKTDMTATVSFTFTGTIPGGDTPQSKFNCRIGVKDKDGNIYGNPVFVDGEVCSYSKTIEFKAGDTIYFMMEHAGVGWTSGNLQINITKG